MCKIRLEVVKICGREDTYPKKVLIEDEFIMHAFKGEILTSAQKNIYRQTVCFRQLPGFQHDLLHRKSSFALGSRQSTHYQLDTHTLEVPFEVFNDKNNEIIAYKYSCYSSCNFSYHTPLWHFEVHLVSSDK